jgi:hypothetical protein
VLWILRHWVMDICDEIRSARGSGCTRCGVVDGRMELVEAARVFGLVADSGIYRSIGRAEADAIGAHILHVDLAYGSEIMSLARAADLWRQFMLLFQGQDVCFATNAGAEAGSWMPATHATFDMGVLVIAGTRVGCLWVEDED